MKAESVDDLYALPLTEFTKARNALAKEAGDKDIAKLRKPSMPAWALNQAARSNKGDVGRFLHAAGRARASADRDVLDELRAAEADVRRAALKAAGGKSNLMADVNALLAAAAADEAIGEALANGTLTGDEEPSEFVLAPATKAKAKANPPKKDEVREARERKAREEAKRQYEDAAERAKELDDEADRLTREADEAEDRAAKLRARAETARDKADKAKAKAADLKAALP